MTKPNKPQHDIENEPTVENEQTPEFYMRMLHDVFPGLNDGIVIPSSEKAILEKMRARGWKEAKSTNYSWFRRPDA